MRFISGIIRQTALSWLPVLANIKPPYKTREEHTQEVTEATCGEYSWQQTE